MIIKLKCRKCNSMYEMYREEYEREQKQLNDTYQYIDKFDISKVNRIFNFWCFNCFFNNLTVEVNDNNDNEAINERSAFAIAKRRYPNVEVMLVACEL